MEGKDSKRKMEEIRRVHEALKKKKKYMRKAMRFKSWRDRSCARKKREVQRAHRRWKKGKITKKIFRGKEKYEKFARRKEIKKKEEKRRKKVQEMKQICENL